MFTINLKTCFSQNYNFQCHGYDNIQLSCKIVNNQFNVATFFKIYPKNIYLLK